MADPRSESLFSFKVLLGTLCGNGYLLVATPLLATLALLSAWIGPHGGLFSWVARVWSRGLLLFSGVKTVPVFEKPLDPQGQYVFMANHRSLFDIPVLLTTLPGQTRFLAKKSLFQIPIFGWAMKMGGFVTIDRKDLSTARDSFADAVAQLEEAGVSVLVFPEGTRSLDEKMLSFQRGGFLLALKSGLSIVPVGIAGTARIQPKKSLRIRPGTVRIDYGSPVPVQEYGVSRKNDLIRAVRDKIERLLAAR